MTWVVVALFQEVASEDPSEVVWVRGPFSSAEEAQAYAERQNERTKRLTAEYEQAERAWNARRKELFGGKYPLSKDERRQLGPYPDDPYPPSVFDIMEITNPVMSEEEEPARTRNDECSEAVLKVEWGEGNDDHKLEWITMADLPPV